MGSDMLFQVCIVALGLCPVALAAVAVFVQ